MWQAPLLGVLDFCVKIARKALKLTIFYLEIFPRQTQNDAFSFPRDAENPNFLKKFFQLDLTLLNRLLCFRAEFLKIDFAQLQHSKILLKMELGECFGVLGKWAMKSEKSDW